MGNSRQRQAEWVKRQREAGKTSLLVWVDSLILKAFREHAKGRGEDVGKAVERLLLGYVNEGRGASLTAKPVEQLPAGPEPTPAPVGTTRRELEPAPVPTRGATREAGGDRDFEPPTGAELLHDELFPHEVKVKLYRAVGGYTVMVDGREAGRVERRLLQERPKVWRWYSMPAKGLWRVEDHHLRSEAVERLVSLG